MITQTLHELRRRGGGFTVTARAAGGLLARRWFWRRNNDQYISLALNVRLITSQLSLLMSPEEHPESGVSLAYAPSRKQIRGKAKSAAGVALPQPKQITLLLALISNTIGRQNAQEAETLRRVRGNKSMAEIRAFVRYRRHSRRLPPGGAV